MRKKPETSIIIRTFNEEKHLPALLTAIEGQTYRDVEVIVVDSGSYDRTPSIAQHAGAKLLTIDSPDFTFGFSLNTGIQRAAGKYVVIVSAHTLPTDTRWLSSLLGPFRDEKLAMVYGRQLGLPESKFSERRDFERLFGAAFKEITPPHYFANNANSAIRADLWRQYRFDETLPGCEDIDWAKHWIDLGYKVVYEPKAAIYHIHDETWEQVRKRHYREAAALRSIGLKSPANAPGEILSEIGSFLGDFASALRGTEGPVSLGEIVRFRYNKTVGTTLGLMNGKIMSKPQKRDEVFYTRKSKAVVIRGPHTASYEDMKVPEVKPGDVLIEVAYEGVCGTDIEILEGTLGYFRNGLSKYPIVPGHEFSGWITRVGTNVQNLKIGDRVVVECIQSCGRCENCLKENWVSCVNRREVGVMGLDGGYAHYVAVPARFVHKIPDSLELKKAALCEPLAVVHKGLRRIEHQLKQLGKSDGCAVVGAGPIGHLCAQVLRKRGYKVSVIDQTAERLSYFSGTQIDTGKDLRVIKDHRIVIEATGDPRALGLMLKNGSPGTSFLLLGLPYARQEFSFEEIVAYDRAIIGSVGSSKRDFIDAIKLLPTLPTEAFLQSVLPLENYQTAWVQFRRKEYLKVLLRVSGD